MNMYTVSSIIVVLIVHSDASKTCSTGSCECCRTGTCADLSHNLGACNGCIDGYTGPDCFQPCPPNCVNCSQTYFTSDRTCDVCISGYYNGKFKDIHIYSAQTDCTLACKENCKLCLSYYNCIRCEDGYFLNDKQDCVSCPVNCKSCTFPASCDECSDGYFWSDILCQRCDSWCNSCSSFYICSKCYTNTTLKISVCENCNAGCLSCDAQNVCTLCQTGYALNGSHCTECGQHCSECTLNSLVQQYSCIACIDGYYLSSNVCNKCGKGCKSCHSDVVCNKCDNEYRLQKGICTICHPSCIECSSENVCLSCQPGSYSDGVECHPCNPECLTCESGEVCLSCKDGFYGDDCAKACPRNCNNNSCSQQNGKCISCAHGYYFDDSTKCVICPEHCLTCQNKSTCDFCHSGYMGTSCQNECSNCKPGTECNKTNGLCLNSCSDGLSGNNCDMRCSTMCLACDRVNPSRCITCPVHMFGSSCSEPCSDSCLNKTCSEKDGRCTFSCVNGHWGVSCENNCSEHCKNQVCERNNGTCVLGCVGIYTGSNCLCPRNCVCDDIGTCISCKEGFGDICENTCSEGCLRKLCHRMTGECLEGCKEGLNGSYCVQVVKGLIDQSNELSQLRLSDVGLIIGPLSIVFLFVVGLGFFIYKKRDSACVRSAQNTDAVLTFRYSEHSHESYTDNGLDDDLEELDDSYDYVKFQSQGVYSELTTTDEERYYSSLSLSTRKVRRQSLEEYVTNKTPRDYLDEFQQLPSDLIKPYTESQKKENLKKNRYKEIYPYDSTLVALHGGTSDYINASYIDGYKKRRAYIATVGPTTQYMDDMSVFWRMVWQEKSGKIVMLTNIDEQQAYRCDRYWPENEYSSVFDNITVSPKYEVQFSSYTVRTLEVQCRSEKRQVQHFHFTAWQEKRLPTNIMDLVEFQQKVARSKPESDGPLIVHCSAGVGRTGTYIALDMLIQEMEAEDHVDIFRCVKNLRKQRVKMVQTVICTSINKITIYFLDTPYISCATAEDLHQDLHIAEQYKYIHHALVSLKTVYTHLEERRRSGKHVYEECNASPNTYTPLMFED